MLPTPLTVCKDASGTPEYIAADTALLMDRGPMSASQRKGKKHTHGGTWGKEYPVSNIAVNWFGFAVP